MDPDRLRRLTLTRLSDPCAVQVAAARRERPGPPDGDRVLIIAADHPARGVVRTGGRSMTDRADLLDRLCVALSRPGVTGVLGTADILEDLLLLGALDGKLVFGSMNRGGLGGSVFEVDDRFTGYDARSIVDMEFEGGKMLLRVDLDDDRTAPTLEACARAVTELAGHGRIAMVEPFLARRVHGALVNDLSAEAVTASIGIASGLGGTSAYTWLKLPAVDDMERVAAATTLPILLLGGDSGGDHADRLRRWEAALRPPNVCGLVVGRSLLYPSDDDVAAATDQAVSLL
ncbi:Cgl0159 family (beta/alpha)8-fold protein [Stackebrandtia nassauensis]|uniref:Cgl0159-like domain-containing protein n=1 Tax=Stackebrandtia nassauensis (strain DSM 44728 / CIP 108903 / NRRL B-16338 / NBRC 102104 / LLR-40K-21) TaxID=446470 RepID=D3Q6X5_STANL|nr:hypothetical protein [Stackebrandtia nassauensis]ADD40374.1 hypothetical protein Snas_0661 [Stackebrandtia nassauensis DSM 44728]